jgi:hypothetical protein
MADSAELGQHLQDAEPPSGVSRRCTLSGLEVARWIIRGWLAAGWLVALWILVRPINGPYHAITGHHGHELPEMYGKVPEKTIWLYWKDRGTIPDFVQLCIETIEHNRGGFEVRVLYEDDVDKYVSRIELPVRWSSLMPAQQKDSLMNALLARYGGVALDATMVLFKPLDAWWDEMLTKGAFFRGFMYPHIETAVWFLMARKEGLFRSATTAQVIGMGDDFNTDRYSTENRDRYFAFGDGTITPIIGMYDHTRRKCFKPADGAQACYPPVPEGEESLGASKLMIADPGQSAQLPYATDYSFPLWNVQEHAGEWDIFIQRQNAPGLMPFVKMFQSGGPAKKYSRKQLLAMKDSFFCHWLRLAGHSGCGQEPNATVINDHKHKASRKSDGRFRSKLIT